METDRLNNNENRINTKEELIEILKKYTGILNNSMIDYLNSLIELEFSVIKDYIGVDDRNLLSELEVYKKIAMYNIYNRAINIFKQSDSEFIISDSEGRLNISTLLGERKTQLFDFDYSESFKESPEEYKNIAIGEISLFQTFENKKLREEELMRIKKLLTNLYDDEDYTSYDQKSIMRNKGIIYEYKELIKQLDKKKLSDEDKREIEITKQFHDLLLDDYGLTDQSFKEEYIPPLIYYMEHKTKLQKTLVRKMTNINIKNNIRYI